MGFKSQSISESNPTCKRLPWISREINWSCSVPIVVVRFQKAKRNPTLLAFSYRQEDKIMKIEVFDPAMCCPTGVCGPSVDQELVRVAADLETLKRKGIDVSRYNLAQDVQVFAFDPTIKELLAKHGPDCLPVILVNGELKMQGEYPSTAELYQWFGIEEKPRVILPFVSLPSEGDKE
jgi:hypothetical protein